MIFKSTLVTALFITTSSCGLTLKEKDCNKFKIGIFKYHGKESNNVYLIERNDSIQIETNITSGHVVKTKIKWKDDCRYELVYLSENGVSEGVIPEWMKPKTLKLRIIDIGNNYCVFTWQIDGISKVLTDTLWRINN